MGLHYEVDSSHIGKETAPSSGHGRDYYASSAAALEEIVANYQAINLLAPENELFKILKSILGDDFIVFLDTRCQLLNSSSITIENNNNILK